jgi:tRNA pseudouridine55 synthase
MTGVLLVDKPSGPTSHDVVARVRRSSGERRIGHTGTLDPTATGLLPLVLGQATRLSALLTGGDKTYEATIRLGFATATDDTEGEPLGLADAEGQAGLAGAEGGGGVRVAAGEVEAALAAFRGSFDQKPPVHSAKKVGGRRAYDLARQDRPVELTPVGVTVHALELLSVDGDLIRLRVTATAGFYVRALARDLGDVLGCGAHLHELRRTRSGTFDVADAVPLDEVERLGPAVADRLISPSEALPSLLSVRLTEAGLKRARHGNPVGPEHVEGHWVPPSSTVGPVKVVTADGELLALAHSRGGALHPVVVLG